MRHDAGARVLGNFLLEEIRLSFKRDHLHEVERVLHFVDLKKAIFLLVFTISNQLLLLFIFSSSQTGIRVYNLFARSKIFVECYLWAVKLDEEAVCDELDVGLHQVAVHADQADRQRVCQELLFNAHRVADDCDDLFLRRLLDQVFVHQAREVGVET